MAARVLKTKPENNLKRGREKDSFIAFYSWHGAELFIIEQSFNTFHSPWVLNRKKNTVNLSKNITFVEILFEYTQSQTKKNWIFSDKKTRNCKILNFSSSTSKLHILFTWGADPLNLERKKEKSNLVRNFFLILF